MNIERGDVALVAAFLAALILIGLLAFVLCK